MTKNAREQMIDRILDAAIQCVIKDGVDHVQVTEVAARTGISTRTLNRYYPEKEQLFADAAAKYIYCTYADFADRFEKMDFDGMTGLERLTLLLKSQLDYCRADSAAMIFVDMRMYRAKHDAQKHVWTAPDKRRIHGIVLDCVQRGKADGSIRADVDEAQLLPMISASYNGIMQRLALVYSSMETKEKKEESLILLDGYIDMLRDYLRPRD